MQTKITSAFLVALSLRVICSLRSAPSSKSLSHQLLQSQVFFSSITVWKWYSFLHYVNEQKRPGITWKCLYFCILMFKSDTDFTFKTLISPWIQNFEICRHVICLSAHNRQMRERETERAHGREMYLLYRICDFSSTLCIVHMTFT